MTDSLRAPADAVSEGRGAIVSRHWSQRKLWAFRLVTVGLVLCGAAGCEGMLRLCGVGDPLRLVTPLQPAGSAGTHQLNRKVDRVYFGRLDMYGPEPRPFVIPRPEGIVRIVFLGASTVNGFPFGSEIAFPRQVELLLQAQHAEVKFEVLNAGITAINSFEIVDLARDCLACQPDIVVVHMGHNEYYGPGGPGSTALTLPPRLVPWSFAARRLRGLQVVSDWFPTSRSAQANPLEALPRTREIQWQGPVYQQGVENFRSNLDRVVECLQVGGVEIVLSTVASNLRDQGPIQSVWPLRINHTDLQRIEELLIRAKSSAEVGDWSASLAHLETAAGVAKEVATVQYHRGEALLQLGRVEEAHAAFGLARDYDGCRFRAPSEFAEIVRERVRKDGRLHLVDIEAAVNRASLPEVPGRDQFLEHVHYTLEGHRLVGREFARRICEDVLKLEWDPERELSEAALDHALGLLPEDELTGATFALEVLDTPPLSASEGVDDQRAYLRERIGRLFSDLPATRREPFADLSLQAMQSDLAGALVGVHAARGQWESSREIAEVAVRRRPWAPEAWLHRASAEWAAGRIDTSRAACATALRLRPGWEPAVELQARLSGD